MRVAYVVFLALFLLSGGCEPSPEEVAARQAEAERVAAERAAAEAAQAVFDEAVKVRYKEMLTRWTATKDGATKVLSKTTTDEFTGRKTYRPPNAPKYINSKTCVYGELAEAEGSLTPMVVFNYAGDDWLFWSQVIILTDGETTTLTASPKTDHGGGTVGEWATFLVGENRFIPSIPADLVRRMATARETKVSFRGQRRTDYTLKKWEKDSLAAVSYGERPTLDDARAAEKAAVEKTAAGPKQE